MTSLLVIEVSVQLCLKLVWHSFSFYGFLLQCSDVHYCLAMTFALGQMSAEKVEGGAEVHYVDRSLMGPNHDFSLMPSPAKHTQYEPSFSRLYFNLANQ